MITITNTAAEQIQKVQSESEELTGKLLRVIVEGGGCSGNRYQMGFDELMDGDAKFESNGVSILVDKNSLNLISGSEIDFVNSPEGSTFVFNNPYAKKSCGCGKSSC
jgi:iron-sulfur cluster assembly accessory protein